MPSAGAATGMNTVLDVANTLAAHTALVPLSIEHCVFVQKTGNLRSSAVPAAAVIGCRMARHTVADTDRILPFSVAVVPSREYIRVAVVSIDVASVADRHTADTSAYEEYGLLHLSGDRPLLTG